MEITSLCIMLSSLNVSPDRSQFFEYESVSLSCEEEEEHQGNSTGWRVKGETQRELRTCGNGWGSVSNASCIMNTMYSFITGVYWCESDSGERSHAVNITVMGGEVILESPPLPVKEGDNVTLRCAFQDKETKEIFTNFKAYFYKDGSLISTESTGEMTIPAVSKSDEGLYKCKGLNLGKSPESWLAVRDTSCSPSSILFILPLPSLPPLPSPLFLLSVVGAGLSLSLLVLLVVLFWRTPRDLSDDGIYTRITFTVDKNHKPRRGEVTSLHISSTPQ